MPDVERLCNERPNACPFHQGTRHPLGAGPIQPAERPADADPQTQENPSARGLLRGHQRPLRQLGGGKTSAEVVIYRVISFSIPCFAILVVVLGTDTDAEMHGRGVEANVVSSVHQRVVPPEM